MSFSLRQIRYFLATAETGQVSQGAVQLNVSQSAVTAAIKQLEDQLGVRLFARVATGVSLTAEGLRFLQHARSVLAAVNAASNAVLSEAAPTVGIVRLGVTYTVAGYFLPRHLAQFSRSYPGITIEMVELPREAIESGLRDGSLDLAVLLVSNLRDRKGLDHDVLLRSRRRLWLCAAHPLLDADAISLTDVSTQNYIMLTVDEAQTTAARYWDPTGLQPNIKFHTSSVEAVRSMVADGMGVTILSDMVYRPWSLEGQRIELRTLSDPVPSMDVGVSWQKDRLLSNATQTLRHFLKLQFGDQKFL
jgi:DNA-binding transcriptional LysR family regulator